MYVIQHITNIIIQQEQPTGCSYPNWFRTASQILRWTSVFKNTEFLEFFVFEVHSIHFHNLLLSF